jgi:hypothetical protein
MANHGQPQSKKSPARRVRKGTSTLERPSHKAGRGVVLEFVGGRFESFFDKQGGGILVRKDRTGYTLVLHDSGMPVAQLRHDAQKVSFEVFYWVRSRERWQRVGEWGVSLCTLDEALDYITTDPLDCFWL